MVAALLLASCDRSKPFADPAAAYLTGGAGMRIDPLPASIASCPPPAEIPWDRVGIDDTLPLAEVLRTWGEDRRAGAICRNNLRLVKNRYEDLRATFDTPEEPSLLQKN